MRMWLGTGSFGRLSSSETLALTKLQDFKHNKQAAHACSRNHNKKMTTQIELLSRHLVDGSNNLVNP